MVNWPLIIGIQLAAAAVAAGGAWRAAALRRDYPDPRLARLQWFFILYGGAVAVHAVGGIQRWLSGGTGDQGPGAPGPPPGPPQPGLLDLADPLSWHIVGHHVLLLAALLLGLVAFGTMRRRAHAGTAGAAGAAALALPGFLIPGATLVEAALSFIIAARSGLNYWHLRRASALRVAAGFALFFLGHLLFYLLRDPSGPRPMIGEVLALAGSIVLVTALPKAHAPAPRHREA